MLKVEVGLTYTFLISRAIHSLSIIFISSLYFVIDARRCDEKFIDFRSFLLLFGRIFCVISFISGSLFLDILQVCKRKVVVVCVVKFLYQEDNINLWSWWKEGGARVEWWC